MAEAELKAELGLGCSDTCIRLIVSPGSGCTWADHWYVDIARKTKSHFRSRIRCTLQWQADFEAIDQRAHPNNWKAALLESQLRASPSHASILLGHSSGGNAALEVAERHKMAGLVVIGAGYSQWDRRCAGIDIRPWNFDSIVANVSRRIVVLHGADDHVIHNTEGQTIASGLRDAVTRAGNVSVPQLDIRVHQAGVGHAMQQLCPVVLLDVLSALIHELLEEGVDT
jgi:pimeloyl-ACP methyl ester carboxylesterase